MAEIKKETIAKEKHVTFFIVFCLIVISLFS
jgi:hypothetical protein